MLSAARWGSRLLRSPGSSDTSHFLHSACIGRRRMGLPQVLHGVVCDATCTFRTLAGRSVWNGAVNTALSAPSSVAATTGSSRHRPSMRSVRASRLPDGDHLPTPTEVVEGSGAELAPFTTSVLKGNGAGVRVLVAKGNEHTLHSLKHVDDDDADDTPTRTTPVATGTRTIPTSTEVSRPPPLRPKPWEAAWMKVTFPLGSGSCTPPTSGVSSFKRGRLNEFFAMPFEEPTGGRGVRWGRLFELLDAFVGSAHGRCCVNVHTCFRCVHV